MPSYWELLLLVMPVFALMGVGVAVRRANWIEGDAETGLIKIVVNLCYPALIFESVANNAALSSPSNLILPPLAGFFITWASIQIALLVAKLIGLHVGNGQRTFALSVGITNYAYLPIPIMTGIWGAQSIGVLMVHNVGVEAAVWTVGLLVLSGQSLRDGWRRLFSPIVVALVLGLIFNLAGWTRVMPKVAIDTLHALAVCGIPLGVLMTGVNMANFLKNPAELFEFKVSATANVMRLLVLPIAILLIAKYLPCSIDLKRVLVVQAAMPAAVIPILIARLYGGHPKTAVQIMLTTTALGLFAIPFWIGTGLAWVGA